MLYPFIGSVRILCSCILLVCAVNTGVNSIHENKNKIDLTEVSPAAADAALSEIFRVPEGTPLLYLDELDYDKEGMPMLYSPQYYVGGVISHTLLRMKF